MVSNQAVSGYHLKKRGKVKIMWNFNGVSIALDRATEGQLSSCKKLKRNGGQRMERGSRVSSALERGTGDRESSCN
jgi:hypothetical protein